jgi:hypothetical protein
MMSGILSWRIIACLLAVQPASAFGSSPLAALFPELHGWNKAGQVELFQPETLYEHINGAAENFLSFDFRQLAVLTYANDERQSVSAEIYLHGTAEDAFGIYSSEKPLAGNYLAIGGQGYAEEGLLNFVSDAYYVKLNGFDLGMQGQSVLTSLAEKIARAIGGRNALPEILSAFPAKGKIEHSERYIRANFLGHEFLCCAYTADYLADGQRFQLFIIQAGSQAKARAMLEKYASLDKTKTETAFRPGTLLINDPYLGPMTLDWRGAYIWGSNSQTAAAAAGVRQIGDTLPE